MTVDLSLERKHFYKSLFAIVGPIALQNLLSSAVNSLDVVMLGFVGQTALASVSLANQVQFVLTLFFVGLGSGLTILTSQYWGKNDVKAIRFLTGTALRLSAFMGFLFAAGTIFIPEKIMAFITDEQTLIECGSKYLSYVGLSYFFMAISQVYQAVFKSVDHVKIATFTTMIALVINLVFNALFIFGWLGFPKLGVVGIAVSTVIARTVELIICLIWGFKIPEVKITPFCIFLRSRELSSDFVKYSLPALGGDFSWGFAFAMYSVILGHLGEDIVAANSVVQVIKNLASILCFGMAYGGAILLGKQIGEGNMEKVERNAARLVKSTLAAGALGSIVMICFLPVIPYLAELNETAARYRTILLIISSYSLFGCAVNTVFMCGIFRAGGDAKFGLFMDTFFMWCVSLPLGCLAAFVFKLSPLWVYFILFLDEFEKIPFVIHHYKKRTWLKNITRD